MKRTGAVIATFAAAVATTLAPARAGAHQVGLSRGVYVVDGATLVADIILARPEIVAVVPRLDPNHDGRISEGDLSRASDGIAAAVVDRLVVTGDGMRCPGALASARLTEADGIALRARYTCARPPRAMLLDFAFVGDLSSGHRHQVTITSGARSLDVLAYRGQTAFEFRAAVAAPPSSAAPSRRGYAWSLFLLGVEHILTGYDHLVFLVALVLIGGRPRALLATVTAFTLGHSVSLALATLGVFAPSPRLVEPAIALSIAYVGLENLFVKRPEIRWRITLPFGFVHGFGFAAALHELELPRPKVPLALAMFNLGVEAGQLAILSLVLPLVLAARRSAWFRERGVKLLSGAIMIAGVVWFIERLL